MRVTANRLLAVLILLSPSACSGIYLGDNPGPDVRKESGPLIVPPAAVRNGTAQDL